MSAWNVKATRGQISRLMGDLEAVPSAPVGEHLTDDEFVAYSMSELSPDASAKVDTHLMSCDECAAQMERLFEVGQEWQGHAGASRVAALSNAIRTSVPAALSAMATAVNNIAYHAALPAVAGAPLDLPVPNGHVVIADDAERNLHIGLSSFDLSLEGSRLLVQPFNASLTLELVAADQVGGEIMIPWTARQNLPPNATISLLGEAGARS